MGYEKLMVHLELSDDNSGLLDITAELAERFGAGVIGIAACQPIQVLSDQAYGTGDAVALDRVEISREIAAAEAQFRSALEGRIKNLEWRSEISYRPLADYVAEQARAADLVITGRDIGVSLLDNSRRVSIGTLAMRAGRPVLVVPRGVKTLPLQHIIVGWKETGESHRAVADALPLLRVAEHVTVLQVAPRGQLADARAAVSDVAAWLHEHGVVAEPVASEVIGMEIDNLRAELAERRCGLLVAGAYGRNRLSEWVFGGVAQDILLDPDYCVLLSH